LNQSRFTGIGVVALGLVLYFILIPVGVVEPGNIKHMALAPRFWPKIIAAIIAIMGVLLIIKPAEVLKEDSEGDKNQSRSWRDRTPGFSVAFGSLLTFYFLIPHLGMVLPGMVMIFGLMMFAGERRFLLAAAIAISIPLLLYFFFVHIASIPIPLGIFESLRG
jgi:putative tricarboxylic transport membrane protein